jgi:hypothetical protein
MSYKALTSFRGGVDGQIDRQLDLVTAIIAKPIVDKWCVVAKLIRNLNRSLG